MSELTVKIPFGHSYLNITLSKERLRLVKVIYPPLTMSSSKLLRGLCKVRLEENDFRS